MGTEAINKLDALIVQFNCARVLNDRQRERLRRMYEDQRWNRVWNDGESYQDAFDVQDIYRQDNASFRSTLKKTDQDLAWQCKKVSADFRKYLETGEIPLPHFPMRIAVLLRKAKEHGREKRFLAAWLRHFGGIGNNGTYAQIETRAQKLNVIPIQHFRRIMRSGDVLSVRNEHSRTLTVKLDCGRYGSFEFILQTGDSFLHTAGEKTAGLGFSDSNLNIPEDAKAFPIGQDS